MPNPMIPVPINNPISEEAAKIHRIVAATIHMVRLVNIIFLGDTNLYFELQNLCMNVSF